MCLPPPPQPIPWKEVGTGLTVAATETTPACLAVGGGVVFAGGMTVGSMWAMEDMGPDYPDKGGWVETYPLGGGGELLQPTYPFPGTDTMQIPSVETFPVPEIQEPGTLPFPTDVGIELPIIFKASGNTNPFIGPVDQDILIVDGNGNVIPVNKGEQLTGSPDGKYIQVRDETGKPTGVRLDGPHKPASHPDPRAQVPHAHNPEITNEDGTPWLPVKFK
jgi:hypothetical protein